MDEKNTWLQGLIEETEKEVIARKWYETKNWAQRLIENYEKVKARRDDPYDFFYECEKEERERLKKLDHPFNCGD